MMQVQVPIDAVECAICYGILSQPHALPCNHTFCGGCIESLREATGTGEGHRMIKCPICRKRVRVDEGALPENKPPRAICELVEELRGHQCAAHPGTIKQYYCKSCDVCVCDKCALLGAHKGHAIVDLAAAGAGARAVR